MTEPLLGIVCGMTAEARALGALRRDPRIAVAVSGGLADRAEAQARRLVEMGARRLLSWGIAGGLDPALPTGALIVAAGVIGPQDEVYVLQCPCGGSVEPPDKGTGVPASAAASASPKIVHAVIAGSDTLLLEPAAKTVLRARTGAAAVDMESHRIAAVAAEAGLPCFALRAISDQADRPLPQLAATALGADGRPRVRAVLAGLARRPADLPPLLRAARDSRTALAALIGVAENVIGPLLAY
jgi:adenosylhomocysteine nucleosidase